MENDSSTFSRSVILAVDDDENDIDLMRLLFRKAGITYPIHVYYCGEDMMDALNVVMTKPVEAVLPLLCFVDVKMPSINGHELLRWIRQQPELDPISVVMLSSSEHPADVKEAADGGAQCYLTKYPQPAVLKKVLDEAERVAQSGTPAPKEWFRIPANLLLLQW